MRLSGISFQEHWGVPCSRASIYQLAREWSLFEQLPDLEPLLQLLLVTFAGIDFAYDREKLSNSSEGAALKLRVLGKIKQQHRERQEPYIQQLAVLQQRTGTVSDQSKQHD